MKKVGKNSPTFFIAILKQRLYHLRHVGDGHKLDLFLEFFARLHVFGGQNHPLEAHFEALVHPFFGKVYGAHFAR